MPTKEGTPRKRKRDICITSIIVALLSLATLVIILVAIEGVQSHFKELIIQDADESTSFLRPEKPEIQEEPLINLPDPFV